MWTVATYVLSQKLRGRKRYPLVLMLEPLFRCNLACAGCGKIQYPAHILKQNLSPEECFRAVEECGAPMVSIPGGEPLMHPQIQEIVAGLVARKKYIYLCTNALLLKEKIGLFQPSKYLTFSVHMDGQKEHHDFSVCKEGGYELAADGIREAVRRGFRVTTNTTLFRRRGSKERTRLLRRDDGLGRRRHDAFARLRLRQGAQSGTMARQGAHAQPVPNDPVESQSCVDLQYVASVSGVSDGGGASMFARRGACRRTTCLDGKKPCYVLQDGYADSFAELMEATEWHKYGTESGNPKCANCMMHSGYEATAVDDNFGTLSGFLTTVRATFFSKYPDRAQLALLNDPVRPAPIPLVQIDEGSAEEKELQV